MVAAGNGRDGLAVEVTMAKAKEVGTTDAETGGGLGGVEGTGVEVVEGAMEKSWVRRWRIWRCFS